MRANCLAPVGEGPADSENDGYAPILRFTQSGRLILVQR